MRSLLVTILNFILITISSAQEKPFLLNGTLIDPSTLKPLVEEKFKSAFVSDDYIKAYTPNRYWKLFDHSGNQIIEGSYESIHSKNNLHVAAVGGWSAEHKVFDWQGKQLFSKNCNEIKPYQNGYAVFINNSDEKKYGVIDKSGKEVVKPIYQELTGAIDISGKPYFIAREDDKYGVIDLKGKPAVPFEYEDIKWLKDDLFLLMILDKVTPEFTGSFGKSKIFDFGLWSKSSGFIRNMDIDHVDLKFTANDGDYLKVRENRDEKLGLMNLEGKVTVPCDYDEIIWVGDGMISVGKAEPSSQVTKYALSDLNGALMSDFMFSSLGLIGEGLIPFCMQQNNQNRCGYMDKNLQLKIPMDFYSVGQFNDNNQANVTILDASGAYKAGVINGTNDIIVPLVFPILKKATKNYYIGKINDNEFLLNASDGEPADKSSLYVTRLYAEFHMKYKNYAAAAMQFEKIKESGTADDDEIANLGLSLARSGQYDKAIPILNQTIGFPAGKHNRDTKLAWVSKAYAYWKKGSTEEAKALYQEFFEMMPNEAELRLEFAELLQEMQLEKEAIAQYDLVIKQYPQAFEVYRRKGVAELIINLVNESIASFNKALELNPDHKETLFDRGQAYAIKGDHQKAIMDFEKAAELHGELSTMHYHLADSYLAYGNKSKACEVWSQLAQYDEKAKAKVAENCK
ncbi:MAG: WG repeat-containing protein [Cyclobacteriaceae bacterium]